MFIADLLLSNKRTNLLDECISWAGVYFKVNAVIDVAAQTATVSTKSSRSMYAYMCVYVPETIRKCIQCSNRIKCVLHLFRNTYCKLFKTMIVERPRPHPNLECLATSSHMISER